MNNYLKAQIFFAIVLLILFTLNSQAENNQADKDFRKLEVTIPMSDGTSLATAIYLPNVNFPVPVILVRTPYQKEGIKGAADKYLKSNIAVVA